MVSGTYLQRLCSLVLVMLVAGCGSNRSVARRADRPSLPVDLEQRTAPPLEEHAQARAEIPTLSEDDSDSPSIESLQQDIVPIGRNLAAGVTDASVQFEFGMLRNLRPQVCHTPDGYISVSSGLLAKLKSKEELAAVLALEMAECLVERQQTPPDSPSLPAIGSDDAARDLALAAKIQRQQQPITDGNVHSLAETLLQQAGYQRIDIAGLRKNLDDWTQTGPEPQSKFESVELLGN